MKRDHVTQKEERDYIFVEVKTTPSHLAALSLICYPDPTDTGFLMVVLDK